jgi:hypothetical protein
MHLHSFVSYISSFYCQRPQKATDDGVITLASANHYLHFRFLTLLILIFLLFLLSFALQGCTGCSKATDNGGGDGGG